MIAALHSTLFKQMNHRERIRNSKTKTKKQRTRSLQLDDKVRYVLPKECQEFFHKLDNLAQLEMDDESFKAWYRKTSGMHSVQQWLENYDDHPYGWAALLMIHGTEEVGSRLRSKVENYAVYSAVLLAASVVLLIDPNTIHETDELSTKSGIVGRAYLYSMAFSVTCHIGCILLAMGFTNALNEAARDSDVIRMFAEGQGYIATTKVEKTFFGGIFFLFSGVFFSVCQNHSVIDGAIIVVLSVAFLLYVYIPTKKRLFESSSIMAYWRLKKDSEKKDDPYDLTLPVERNKHKVAIGKKLDQMAVDLHPDHSHGHFPTPENYCLPLQQLRNGESMLSVIDSENGEIIGDDKMLDHGSTDLSDGEEGITYQLG